MQSAIHESRLLDLEFPTPFSNDLAHIDSIISPESRCSPPPQEVLATESPNRATTLSSLSVGELLIGLADGTRVNRILSPSYCEPALC